MPTILELFENKDSFKYGTVYSDVKEDKETFVGTETSGLRVRSAAELPNPVLYGNEVIRITARTTPILDDMKGDVGGGGLIGKGLSKITGGKIKSIGGIATAFNKAVGIPITYIPTRLIGPIEGEPPTDPKAALKAAMTGKLGPHSQEPITKSLVGANGTLLGKLLKQSGGGDPKTIVKNVAGEAIQEAKNKIRGALFGDNKDIGPNKVGKKSGAPYNDDNPYSKQLKDSPSYTSEGDKDDFKFAMDIKTSIGIDLSKVSPVYGIRRAGAPQLPGPLAKVAQAANINLPAEGRFGKTEYAFDLKSGQPAQLYSPIKEQQYSEVYKQRDDKVKTLVERGLSNSGDAIALGDPYTTTVNTENGEVTVDGFAPIKDLVPFFIGRYESKTYPMMAFRCAITGLTETSSPSWASNNFVGNPYKYYIFETVERSVSFNLQVYAQNPLELANNWSKLTNLTKLSYPLIEDNMAHPNFVQFTLGDMYKNKVCIMDALTYTFPDNGTWETNIDGLLLPKFIDVAITLKFVENIADGSVEGLYSYPKNDNATGHDLRTGDGKGAIASQHQIYENDNNIEYYITNPNGELKKGSKDDYKSSPVGARKTIKIKV